MRSLVFYVPLFAGIILTCELSEASILRFANGDVAFELLCVPNNKHYGKHEDLYFNGTILKLLTDDQMCDSDAARSIYENVAVYKTRGWTLCGGDLDFTDFVSSRYVVSTRANPAFYIDFAPQVDWQLYHSFYGNMKDPVDTQFIMCVCNSLDECSSIDDALNGATIHGNFSSVPGKLAQAQASALYLFVFRFLFPGLYLITGTMALIFLIITMHRIKGAYGDTPFLNAIINHKGGRTSVIVALLTIESIACLVLAVTQHLGCNTCSEQAMRAKWVGFFMPQLTCSSVATTLLAGVFWLDRRRALERRARFEVETDARPFFVRWRKTIRNLALWALFLDVAIGFMMMRAVPYVEVIVGGIGTIVSLVVGVIFLLEAYKFYSMVSALKKNLSGSSHKLSGLNRMLRISRWFVLSAAFLIIFGFNACTLIIAGGNIYMVQLWVPFFSIAYASRIAMSFSQVMLCMPERSPIHAMKHDVDIDASESAVGTHQMNTVEESCAETETAIVY